jgi:membrane-bound lytic murein transglycosylase D
VAAYNTGENRIRKAIRQSGSRDIWQIIRERRIPRQTRNYVPAFIAAIIVGSSPEKYGLHIEQQDPYQYEEVTVHDSVDLRVIARCCGSDYGTIKYLNPELRRFYTPRSKTGYSLKIPVGTKNQFAQAYSKLSDEDKISWNRHKIRRGETLSVIARKYGVTVSDLMYANNMRNAHLIRTGKVLLIPSAPGYRPPSSSSSRSSASSRKSSKPSSMASVNKPKSQGTHKVVYCVRKGDSLYTIAQRYSISVYSICRWNGISKRKPIYPGNKLVLYCSAQQNDGYSRGGKVGNRNSAGTKVSGSSNSSGGVSTGKFTHVIQRGDTLYQIANTYGVSVKQLKSWNNLKSNNRIYPGRQLVIYSSSGYSHRSASVNNTQQITDGNKLIYHVKTGDTLWEIGKAFNTHPEKIRSWNKHKNLSIIKPGDRLTIYIN